MQKLIKWYNIQRKGPPGPVGLPVVGYLPFLGKEPHKTFKKMKEKYGDIIGVYLGPKYTVILNEYTVMKEVLSHPYALDKATEIFSFLGNVGFGTINGEPWHEQRKFCLSTARNLGVGKGPWEDLMMEEASALVEETQKHEGKPTDFVPTLKSSLNVSIISLLTGRRLNKEEEADKIQLCFDYADVALKYIGPSNPTSLVPGLRQFCEMFKIGGFDLAAKTVKNFTAFIRDEITHHKTSPSLKDVEDFINCYLNKLSEISKGKATKNYFSEEMLEGNLAVLFLGASDTISSSLGWLLRLMCKYKDMQDKVYAEVIEAVGKDGKVRYEDRHRIPFTFAVLMEMQRFGSIVPLSGTRKAINDIPVRGYVIPKGSDITANLWALHNDPKYWDKPEEFRPERFLTDNGTKLIKQPPSYAPFSVGKRNCPGETIAWMGILIFFTEIVKSFDISVPSGMKLEFKLDGNSLVSHITSQPLCFKLRND
ncbi:cytochrome P450 2B11 [Trichonephila inaurata madagascariensis]|uniref:Cytochrome P450 2B11 n=1 Tax=Trichonephila inaurata madagascariensis TaxID=2747483 RepID=A0A8X6Y8D1_9ARAC|nr:cytochrome P450 2B11 [Trichonephila inaurata madagascariensis]